MRSFQKSVLQDTNYADKAQTLQTILIFNKIASTTLRVLQHLYSAIAFLIRPHILVNLQRL